MTQDGYAYPARSPREFKLCVLDRNPGHVHVAVYAGVRGQTLAYNGTLIFVPGEWEAFRALVGGIIGNNSITVEDGEPATGDRLMTRNRAEGQARSE